MMGNFLTALSGARPDILDRCETERLKFQSLGIAILITSVMATVSMWFALTSAMGLNPIGAFFIALIWGLIILGIDRWLVTSMPPDGSRRWAIAVPRLVLAVLLGTLISTPLVLRIFQSEINAQITVIKQQRASAFLTEQQNSPVSKQVTYWTNDVNNLEQVIASGGNVAINPSDDPQVQSLTKQKNAELALEQQYYKQWQCQLYGGSGCTVKGDGPLAKASQNSYDQALAQVAALNTAIQQREAQLSATDAASEHTRYQQAVSALPAAQKQLNAATTQEDTLRNNFYAQNNATNGLLIRLQALGQLSGQSFTLNAARLLLFLLFLVIECLPVTVKLMQQPGIYEQILAERNDLDLKKAKKALRDERYATSMPSPGAAGDVGGRHGTREEVLDEIWRRRTRVQDMPSWQGSAETEYIDRSEEPDEDSRLDEAIRGMRDLRAPADTDGRRGGIELRYGDDDL
jgi:hypothetical protein